MRRRIIKYSSGISLVSAVLTIVSSTQRTFAYGGNPATPEQQNEIVNYCYQQAKDYWKIHDPKTAIKEMFQNPGKNFGPDEIDLEYEKYFENKSLRTFDNELKLAEDLYKEALKNPNKKWDCKVVSGHMSKYLESKGIEHAFVQFNPGEGGHAVIMYAVNEPSEKDSNKLEKKLYILDMARVVAMTLTQIPKPDKNVFDELWGLDNQKAIKDAKDAARVPLIDYAEWKHGFQNAPIVYVVSPNSTQSLRPKTWVPYDAISLGDYLVNYHPSYAKKYLIFDVAGTDRQGLRRDKNGKPVLMSRRWLREEDVKPKPTFYRTFKMEVSLNGQSVSAPGCSIPYDEELGLAWMNRLSSGM